MADPAPLAALLPSPGETLAPDEILSRFVRFAAASGLALYPAQEEAILELLDGKHVILATPTGSGKSLVAAALHFKALCQGRVSWYTSPIKALANEKFFALCAAFGAERVGMLTGDASINKDAPIVCCTAEILANLVLRGDAARACDVVMDEFHYYSDRERGVAWQLPLLGLPNANFLLMSATLGDVGAIEEGLKALTGRDTAVVRSRERPVPLDFEYRETPLHETIEALVASKRAPIYLVNFTQRAAAEQAQSLTSVNFSTKEEKAAIQAALADAKFDTPFGPDLAKLVKHGIGLHHAGLLPKYRRLVEKLAQAGLLKVVSGTDTLGVGVNVPIRTVLFTQLCKFDGEKVAVLSVRDFQQIAGRAGRKGFDDRGAVVAQAPEHVIENLKLAEKRAGGKKVVMHKPPTRGYAHWDRATFDRLASGTPEPLTPRFEVTHGMLLTVLQSGAGYRRLVELIGRSHGVEGAQRKQRRLAKQRFASLREAGLTRVEARRVIVAEGLQRDFSLHHTLSLWLIDTIARLDRSSESYALDLLSLVEAILEDPMAVLLKQLDRLKTEKLAELKAAGVEYEQRMEELDKLEWPKPNRDFIYDAFNAFAAKHPWVGQENIRPKSIARELVESYVTFGDYVRDYGLERSEGVLLRYLGQVWKALSQTVPEVDRTDEVEDLIAQLAALVRGVDSSLLDEWEWLRSGVRPAAPEAEAPKPYDLAEDPRGLAARVRSELHRLVRALAKRDYGAAVKCIFPSEEWTAARFAEAMAGFYAAHAALVTTPATRSPRHTAIRAAGERRWEVAQVLVDAEGDDDWAVKCTVDLAGGPPGEGPIIRMVGIDT